MDWCTAIPVEAASGESKLSQVLERWRLSAKQWIGLTALCWALVFSYEVASFAISAADSKSTGSALLLFATWKLGMLMEMATFVVLFLFLAQWHMINRAQQLRIWAAEKTAQNSSPLAIK